MESLVANRKFIAKAERSRSRARELYRMVTNAPVRITALFGKEPVAGA
jgi:hypothetical protein